MLKIRLSRFGKKHDPHYRIVVLEKGLKRDGKSTDKIGEWHPKQKLLKIDNNLYKKWVGLGAIPSNTVRNLYNEKSS